MKCCIVSIGDELLIGQTINTNSAWMGEELNKIGVYVNQVLTISDTKESIVDALDNTLRSFQVVLITGGLGPTKDDITKKTLANYFGSHLIENKEALENVVGFFRKFNKEISEVNKQQALIPSNCEMLLNKTGTAPGMLFREQGTIIVSMPGVPLEMKFLMKEYVFPILKNEFELPCIVHHTILTHGLGESYIAEKIIDIENAIPPELSLAYLPSPGKVKLRLTGIGVDEQLIQREILRISGEIKLVLQDYIYGDNSDSLEGLVGELLIEKDKTVATAESLTGGGLAARLTSVSGSSNYMLGGVVAYSSLIKQSVLKVSKNTIEQFNVVSEETVAEMALGCRNLTGADFGVATSGIAGPNGGSGNIPVGTVCIAVSSELGTTTQTFQMGEGRARVTLKSINAALNLLRLELLKL